MIDSPKFTPRNVSKFVAKSMVAAVVAGAVKDVLISRFPATENLNVAGLAGTITGWYVSEKLQPMTDDLVDFAADEIDTFKKNRKQKIAG